MNSSRSRRRRNYIAESCLSKLEEKENDFVDGAEAIVAFIHSFLLASGQQASGKTPSYE
jgi:hypothetical protein